MKTHNGEKPFSSKICDLVEEARPVSVSEENKSLNDLDHVCKLNVEFYAILTMNY